MRDYLRVKCDTIAFRDDYSWSIMITFADTTYTEVALSMIKTYRRLRMTLLIKRATATHVHRYLLSARL